MLYYMQNGKALGIAISEHIHTFIHLQFFLKDFQKKKVFADPLVAIVQVVFRLIRGSNPRSDIKTKLFKKIFLQQLPLSRVLAKTLRIHKITMKSFSKICGSESTLNCQVPPLMYKINPHNVHCQYWVIHLVVSNFVYVRENTYIHT